MHRERWHSWAGLVCILPTLSKPLVEPNYWNNTLTFSGTNGLLECVTCFIASGWTVNSEYPLCLDIAMASDINNIKLKQSPVYMLFDTDCLPLLNNTCWKKHNQCSSTFAILYSFFLFLEILSISFISHHLTTILI